MLRASILLIFLSFPAAAMEMAGANGAQLRMLDKLTGELRDVNIGVGQTDVMGKLTVQVGACRYPADNKTAEAEVHLTIVDAAVQAPVFKGWMIASSPALSALDHPRYDVWVLRCDVPQLDLPEVEALPDESQGEGAATEADDGQ
jgi:hypothetical protein